MRPTPMRKPITNRFIATERGQTIPWSERAVKTAERRAARGAGRALGLHGPAAGRTRGAGRDDVERIGQLGATPRGPATLLPARNVLHPGGAAAGFARHAHAGSGPPQADNALAGARDRLRLGSL